MEIAVVYRPGCRRLPASRIRWLALQVFRSVPCRSDAVCILLTRDVEIRSLNRRFRGRDYPTDVLSFRSSDRRGQEGSLGDIAISVETAARQARQVGWTVAEELQLLVIHGLLHLLGYDHETDRGEMNRVQSRLARRLLGREIPRAQPSEARRAPPPEGKCRP